jgi:hypothetical protein
VLLQVSLSCCALTVLLQSLLNFISNVWWCILYYIYFSPWSAWFGW